jgi:hypothetical protein
LVPELNWNCTYAEALPDVATRTTAEAKAMRRNR